MQASILILRDPFTLESCVNRSHLKSFIGNHKEYLIDVCKIENAYILGNFLIDD